MSLESRFLKSLLRRSHNPLPSPLHLSPRPTRTQEHTKQHGGMGDGEGDSIPALETERQTGPSRFEVACACLNIRVLVQRAGDAVQPHDGGDGWVQVELDDQAQRDGGAVRVSHPRLVVEDASTTTSRSTDKGKERASESDSPDVDDPAVSLRCLNCLSVVLSYPAESDSNPIAPKSKTGRYSLDLSPSSKLVVGADKIADLSNKDKNPDWSDLFRLVMPSSSSSDNAGEPTAEKSDDDDSSVHDMEGAADRGAAASSSRARRTSSSDSIGGDSAAGASSPALRRTSSLRVATSGGGARASSGAGVSPFHSTARARIKRERQILEDKIAQLRKEFEAESKRYIEQADTLANRLKAAGRTSKRTSSPSTTKRGLGAKDYADASGESPGVVVIRGGFDPPETETAEPSQSHNTGFGSHRTPITSPHLATAGNFPALFSSMSGATMDSSPSVVATNTSPDASKKSGIVQPTQPQSPTFRRSRSPSPSRDTSKARNGSKDRNTGGGDNGRSLATEQRESEEQQNINTTAAKRPALNLVRDVSNLEQDLQQRKADKANGDGRGRSTAVPSTTLPTHSVLRNKGQPTNVSSSFVPRGSVPRPRGTWLRLNGLSPSPPADRLLLERPVPDSAPSKDNASNVDAANEDSVKRESLSKHRHVSFKEPEPGSSVEASPAQVEGQLVSEEVAEEQDEVPFDMDEDIQHLANEGELDDDDDAGFLNVEAPVESEKRAGDETKSGSVTRDIVAPGSVAPANVSMSLSSDRRTKAGDSLSALLNDPSSFIGSLKSRNYGAVSLSGRSPYDQDLAGTSVSPNGKDSLSDQAQRLRDLLALDAPSHRGTKVKRDRALASYLRDRSDGNEDDEIKDDELDSLAPVSALATSLPVAIGFHGANKKKEYEFERKTSVPQRESMLVPRLHDGSRHRASKPGQYSPHNGLPSLGEESESASGSRAPSPGGVSGPVNTGIGDALAAGNDETDEARDQLRDLRGKDSDAFVPPHVWKFRDRPVRPVDMLGTSIHDYE